MKLISKFINCHKSLLCSLIIAVYLTQLQTIETRNSPTSNHFNHDQPETRAAAASSRSERLQANQAPEGDEPVNNSARSRRNLLNFLSKQDPTTAAPNICDPTIQRRPIIFGLRCDQEGVEIEEDGGLVIKANERTEILLIGQNLDLQNLSIALTPSEANQQDDCTHTDRVKSFQITNKSSNIAQIEISLPSPGSKVAYYFCLRETGRSNQASALGPLSANGSTGNVWYHQGSSSLLKLYIKQDFLPLYMKIIVIASLLMLSGLFSGLNLGLMALDKNELQVIISCGSETEKRYARAIEPVRRRGNYLLCSILFSNVLVNSTIAVLLEELTSGIVAVMTSTIFIVMFGEILPQAFCSRHGLAVGARTVSITYFCMIITAPLSYPVSRCLDWALGEEIGHAYDRERLMEFIRVTRDYNNLETDEVNIISGALKLKRIHLSEIMTKIEDVYMLDIQAQLDFDTIQAIIEKGYSRIPVHEANNKKNIVALLFAKDLALLDPDDKTPIQTMISFYNHPIMYLFEDTTLDLALNEFKTGKSHMAFVRRVLDDGDRDPIYEITGIVTLEDVIEEIMQMEINDETDTLTDNRRKRRRKEAQVRKDFSQFTNLGQGDLGHNVVTPQLCLAIYQYLATTVEPFSAKYISDSILKRLLSQKIYYKVRMDEQSSMESLQLDKRLYTAGEVADYFIMILEGRVHVVCGRENLIFDGGPFNYFGSPALLSNKQLNLLNASSLQSGAGFNLSPMGDKEKQLVSDSLNQLAPNYQQLPARKESSGTRKESFAGKALSGQFSISMKKLEQSLGEQQQQVAGKPDTQAQLNTVHSVSRLRPSDSKASIHSIDSKLSTTHYVPDYTVEIVTTTSYLKITRNEYLTALKATLVERGGGAPGISGSPSGANIEQADQAISVQVADIGAHLNDQAGLVMKKLGGQEES